MSNLCLGMSDDQKEGREIVPYMLIFSKSSSISLSWTPEFVETRLP